MAVKDVERTIVRKLVTALRDAGDPVVKVWDREEYVPVKAQRDVLDAVFAVDEAFLITRSGSWVRLTCGERWDLICDYTTDLERPLEHVFQWVTDNED